MWVKAFGCQREGGGSRDMRDSIAEVAWNPNGGKVVASNDSSCSISLQDTVVRVLNCNTSVSLPAVYFDGSATVRNSELWGCGGPIGI